MDALAHDLHYALRHLRRSPGFALAAILTLALGIGANTAMFTVLNALMLRELPIKEPGGLIGITSRNQGGSQRPMPILAVNELLRDGPLKDVCGHNGGAVIGGEINGVSTQTVVAFVTGKCFLTFGVMPIMGRPIGDDDAPLTRPGEHVAVISHRFWTRLFGADPNVVGRTMLLEGVQMRVVGVMPEGFGGLNVDAGIDVFAPPDTIIPATPDRRPVVSEILGRLKPGVTLEHASAQLTARWPEVLKAATTGEQAREGANLYGSIPVVDHIGTGISNYRRQYGRPLTLILGLTGVLLVLACINLGGLLLTRLVSRRTELAIRIALGGDARRIAQQMMLENLVLSLTGAALALPLSSAFVTLLVSFIPPGFVEPTVTFSPDHRVLAVTAAIGLLVGLIITVSPLWIALSRKSHTQLASDRTIVGSTNAVTRGLLVAQVALSAVLLVGASLLIRSLYILQRVDLGVRTDNVMTVRLMPRPGATRISDAATHYPVLLERLRALPGVRAVDIARGFPRISVDATTRVSFVGEEYGDVRAIQDVVSPGFFATMGMQLRSGRPLSWNDTRSTRLVAVVNERLARALAPDGDVLERRIRYGTARDLQDIVVVGVVSNATLGNPRLTNTPILYMAMSQIPRNSPSWNVVIVTTGNHGTVASGIREMLQQDGREYAQEITTLDEIFTRAPSSERMSAALAGVIGALAVLLVLIGIHGALAYAVSRRAREIGVRIAIGATPRSAAASIVRESVMVTITGIAIGLPLAIFAARILRTLLFEISENDPLTLTATVGFLLVLGAAAGLVPARRAARVDPMVALRAE